MLMIKGSKISSMHACMQFDIHLNYQHHTEKAAIYYVKPIY